MRVYTDNSNTVSQHRDSVYTDIQVISGSGVSLYGLYQKSVVMVISGGQLEQGVSAMRISPRKVPLLSPRGQHGTPLAPSGISIQTLPPGHMWTTSDVKVVATLPSRPDGATEAFAWICMGPESLSHVQLCLIFRL